MKRKNDLFLIEKLKVHFANFRKISKLEGDASQRSFYRFISGEASFIAMVYPEENNRELERIMYLTEMYKKAGIRVPLIIEQLGSRILILEDIGDISLEKYLTNASAAQKKFVWEQVELILKRLGGISTSVTENVLDIEKMERETDFFIKHFAGVFFRKNEDLLELKEEILSNLKKIDGRRIFAHRDFHSRNIHVKNKHLYLIDFQDSLEAPEYYDAVSFIFDSYTDEASTDLFFKKFKETADPDPAQVFLTAYQRNIKALGTFGFQVKAGNKKFARYILPTIGKIRKNLIFKEKSALGSLFLKAEKNGGSVD